MTAKPVVLMPDWRLGQKMVHNSHRPLIRNYYGYWIRYYVRVSSPIILWSLTGNLPILGLDFFFFFFFFEMSKLDKFPYKLRTSSIVTYSLMLFEHKNYLYIFPTRQNHHYLSIFYNIFGTKQILFLTAMLVVLMPNWILDQKNVHNSHLSI